MGQKVNPNALRLGITRGWDSNWFGGKNLAEKLVEDEKIRKYILARIPNGGISKILIERTLKRITLTINTSKPGVVIGKGGDQVDSIKEELKKLTSKDVQINIYEIKRPELDAKLVGESIAKQLEARMSYRRAMKQAIANATRVGAQGIKLKLSGRLAGAEMARTESYKEGRTPLQTLRADIDYAVSEAQTVYGKIGIKVWIFKGEVYGKRDIITFPTGSEASSVQGGHGGHGGGNHSGNNSKKDNNRNNNNKRRDNNNNKSNGGGKNRKK